MASRPIITAFFDEATFTVSYLVADAEGGTAVIIDPVLDFDPASGEVDTRPADAMLVAAGKRGLTIAMVLETHAHADHLSAAPYIKARTGACVAIGEHIRAVQHIFRPVFAAEDLKPDGGDFDRATTAAKEAEALAKASIFQAMSEKEAWKAMEIR